MKGVPIPAIPDDNQPREKCWARKNWTSCIQHSMASSLQFHTCRSVDVASRGKWDGRHLHLKPKLVGSTNHVCVGKSLIHTLEQVLGMELETFFSEYLNDNGFKAAQNRVKSSKTVHQCL